MSYTSYTDDYSEEDHAPGFATKQAAALARENDALRDALDGQAGRRVLEARIGRDWGDYLSDTNEDGEPLCDQGRADTDLDYDYEASMEPGFDPGPCMSVFCRGCGWDYSSTSYSNASRVLAVAEEDGCPECGSSEIDQGGDW